MAPPRYDVVMIGDLRFPGGTSAAVAEEIRAQLAAGYRTGLIQLKGPLLKHPHPFHPAVRACIDTGLVDLLDPDLPVSAGVVLAHHPTVFSHLPRRGLQVAADQRLLIVHHPPIDGAGEPAYDWATIDRNARDILGGEVLWAPVGPAVRAQFDQLDEPPALLPEDWHNVLDAGPWQVARDGFCEARPVIGRHSRPDPLKWPDDRELTLAIYPDDPRFVVRILGGGPFLRQLVGAYPRNWQVWRFDAMEVARFLSAIDFFVYFHHSRWVEAFGRTIIEAMATGAVTILPPQFRSLFGDAALYAEPEAVRDIVVRFHTNRRLFLEQSERGREAVRRRFGPDAHVRRIEAMIGAPRPPIRSTARPASRPKRVLFMTSNGVGLGHLARLLAIARRCRSPIEPVFLTLSQALEVVHEAGYLVEHLSHHRYLGCDYGVWNRFLRQELDELLAFYDPAALVFDGNVPYQGLIEAIGDTPELGLIWCRRGMWRPHVGADAIARERHFDLVLEPGDLAAAYDQGLTTVSRERTRSVDPIRLLDEDEMLERAEARRELDLADARPAVLLQLGSGNNYDYEPLQRTALARLRQRHDAQIVVAEWLNAEAPTELPDGVRSLATFPFSRYLKAFDLVISAVGYNSFHEILLAGVPAVFVPNEHPEQDDQLARARFAERHGLGACVRIRDVYRLGEAIARLLDPVERRSVAERCAALDHGDGAAQAARIIEEMAFSRRVDGR